MRLSVKLPLFIIVTAAVIISVVVLVSFFVTRNILVDIESEEQTISVSIYANAISFYLDEARSIMEITAEEEELTDFIPLEPVNIELHGVPADVAMPQRNIATSILRHSNIFDYVQFLKPDGTIYLLEPYDLQIDAMRGNQASTDWYKILMSSGSTVVSNLHISNATRQPVVTIATPVRNSDGQLVGIWAGGLSLDTLSKIGLTEPQTGSPERYDYVTDSRGLIIGHQAISKYVQEQTDFISVPAVQAALAGQQGTMQYVCPIDGHEELTAYIPLINTGWAVVYVVPTKVAFAPLYNLTLNTGILGMLAVIVMSLGGWAIARQVTKPIEQLREAAVTIGTGDLRQRIKVTTHDEIGQLAHEFNRMAVSLSNKDTQLREYATHLKEKVEKRTRELQESEDKYRILVEHANEAIVVAQDGVLKFANPKTIELSGYSMEELASMPFVDIIHPDDRDIVVERYLKRLQGELLPSTYPFRVIDKTGNIKWAEINAISIIWDGKPATLNLLTDITERKKAEQQALITAKLASVGELVAGVAHEVNNPLTGIIGYAQLLAERQDVTQDVKDDLQKIYEESQRTVKIVQNLLHFARQYKPEKNLVDINELLARTLELEAYKLRTSNVEVSTKLAIDIPLILADYNQLQQVILNIITNAQQAMVETKRKGKITVITDAVDSYIRIFITDNGPGISQENTTRIFDPFFTTKPVGSGSGLGLSVCHGIITEHGGNIYVESTLGKGTAFTIELPIAAGESAVIKEEPVKQRSHKPHRKSGNNILIVEDEPAIRAILRRNLSAHGYQVQVVSDGKDALDKLAKNIYDLILSDLKMPGMSGSELYEAIKRKHPNSASKVVFVTGDVMTPDTHDFLVSTGRPYLIKPFDSKDIENVIEKVLTGQNS